MFRSAIARCAEAYEIEPGTHIHLSGEGNNPLYIVLAGSVKAEVSAMQSNRSATGRQREREPE